MKKLRHIYIILIFPFFLNCQVLWNEPPDTIWYGNQSRWVEVILPTPKILHTELVNGNQVKLTWDHYWTQELIDSYTNKFGYLPEPNRYSFYRNGEALIGVQYTETSYIDLTTLAGQTYNYEYLASDNNYITEDGLQHWSPRSTPKSISTNKPSILSPVNFIGDYIPSPPSISLLWTKTVSASRYNIYKSYYNSNLLNWNYSIIELGDVNNYIDSDITPYQEYLYSIIAIEGAYSSERSPAVLVKSGAMDFGPPNNFVGYYEPNTSTNMLYWDKTLDANTYTLFKSFKKSIDSNQWDHQAISVGDVDSYEDSELMPFTGYVYTLISITDGFVSERTSPVTISSGTLQVIDEEYWEEVEEYEKDQKIGWFGCSR